MRCGPLDRLNSPNPLDDGFQLRGSGPIGDLPRCTLFYGDPRSVRCADKRFEAIDAPFLAVDTQFVVVNVRLEAMDDRFVRVDHEFAIIPRDLGLILKKLKA